MNKREFLKLSGAAGVAAAMPGTACLAAGDELTNMTSGAKPITVDERKARVARPLALLQENDVDALLLEAGSALIYFTGVRWRRPERFTGAIIPREGEIAFVTPFFEEPSARESMSFGDDVRTWHEHENPFAAGRSRTSMCFATLVRPCTESRCYKKGKMSSKRVILSRTSLGRGRRSSAGPGFPAR